MATTASDVMVDTLHRWFDNQLMGIDNGILDEPRVDVETSPGHWVTSDKWPVSDNKQKLTFHQKLLVQRREIVHGLGKRVRHFGQRADSGQDGFQHFHALGLFGPAGICKIAQIPRQPHAAGHHDAVIRPVPMRGFCRGAKK